MAEPTKSFDIAVLIDSNDHCKHVLCDGITYKMKSRNLHFHTSKKYVKGDIKFVNESCHFVQEIDTKRYINAFIKHSNDITNSFKHIVKIRLFIFKENCSIIWHQYIEKQKHFPSDIVIIVNDKNQPIFLLHDATVNILNESIKFKSHSAYQGNDIKILNFYANKVKTFFINNKWKINLNKTQKTFKNGICYKFASSAAKNAFFQQSYDCALLTNHNNEMSLLLSDCIYIRNDNVLSFKSHSTYKNGYYAKLKECGELMKSVANINEYRLQNSRKAYIFDGITVNKCLLFNIKDIDEWVEYMEQATNVFYDVGVITNHEEKQTYFLAKVHIDLMQNMVNFGACEEFMPKHHGLINKFGKLVKTIALKNFTLSSLKHDGMDKRKLKNIECYQWDLNKPQTTQTIIVKKKSKQKVKNETNKNKIKSKKKVKNKKTANKMLNKKDKYGKYNKNKVLNKKDKYNKNIKQVKKNKNKTLNKNNKYNKKVQSKRGKKEVSYNKSTPKSKNNKKQTLTDKKLKTNKQKVKGKSKKKVVETNKQKSKKKVVKTKNKNDKKKKPKKKDKKKAKKKVEKKRDSLLQPSILKKIERRNSRRNLLQTDCTTQKTTLDIQNSDANNQYQQSNPIVKPTAVQNNIKKASISKVQAVETNKMMNDTNKLHTGPTHDTEGIWNAYIIKYGFEPKNAYQLQNFSKRNEHVRSLSYKEVRHLFRGRSK